jgi:ankyrin repeat protein
MFGGGKPDIISVLINRGADVNLANDDGLTPLMVAAQAGAEAEVVQLLRAAGANLYAKDNEGRTALDIAKTTEGTDESLFE